MARRFHKDRLYRFAGQRWRQSLGRTEPYEMVIIGSLVRNYIDPTARETDCRGEYVPDGRTYRIDDGHLPDYQPRVSAEELPGLMGARAIRFAYPL